MQAALYKEAFEKTQDIVLFLKPTGEILEVNRTALSTYGYTCAEFTKMKIYDIRADQCKDIIDAQLRRACVEPHQFEAVHRRKDGSVFPVEVSCNNLTVNGEIILFSIIRDISERKRVEDQLRYLATHDSLTNIPNRYSFEQALQQAVALAGNGIESSLLFIDLDNFKLVNDNFGHTIGDQLLVNAVGVLGSVLRKTDVLARLGGDEFVVLLEGVSTGEAVLVAEKLRARIEEEELCLNMYGSYFKLTISIGIIAVDGSLSSQAILAYADQALYSAKDCGKNCIKIGGIA